MSIPSEAVEAAREAVRAAMIDFGPDGHTDGDEEITRAALEAAAPHMMAPRLVRAYYRSLTLDGEVWCESADPLEVIKMSKGTNCTFEVVRFYEIDSGWQEWALDG